MEMELREENMEVHGRKIHEGSKLHAEHLKEGVKIKEHQVIGHERINRLAPIHK